MGGAADSKLVPARSAVAPSEAGYSTLTRPRGSPGEGERVIDEATRLVLGGGLVAFPTDTFYGLGVDPFNEAALERLFAVKGRSAGAPVPLLLADAGGIAAVARGPVPPGALRLAEAFWPGALTLVVLKASRLPDAVSAGRDTVGVRVPDHPAPRAIARAAGRPVTGTSANRSGHPPLKRAEEVAAELGDAVDLIVPGECGGHATPSTVVDFTRGRPTVVREGAVPLAEIQRVCPDVAPRAR